MQLMRDPLGAYKESPMLAKPQIVQTGAQLTAIIRLRRRPGEGEPIARCDGGAYSVPRAL